MAGLADPTAEQVRNVLDPGAGSGILACAVCEKLGPRAEPIHIDAYEADPRLADHCEAALDHARSWLSRRSLPASFAVHRSDYVLANADALDPSLFMASASIGRYDLGIANPPYFKLGKSDRRAVATSAVIHGQPNIYALFLSLIAVLLRPGGLLVTITPRSFATGDYFRAFRRHFFDTITPEAVHVFDSRKAAFADDAVLQENVILKGRKMPCLIRDTVDLSISNGLADLEASNRRAVPLRTVVDRRSRDVVLHLPTEPADDHVRTIVEGWPATLHRLGLEVSTGPVVAFRARRYLRLASDPRESVAPLLWLQNVHPMAITWPLSDLVKAQYIVDDAESQRLLLPDKSYVVLRRFTAKEERRRIVAAPLIAGFGAGRRIGLENHLNYIHRPRGHMEEHEVLGLSALLGSALIDRYFRVASGTTQVNASELRRLPLPARETVSTIGRQVARSRPTGSALNELVTDVLGLPVALVPAGGDT